MSALVVSMHDVSPMTREVFTAMLRELACVGVTKTSLLVIPDHHHRGNMLNDVSFCRWVEGLAKAGHELVVHGYYHQRHPHGNETARQRWINSVYTQGEGEFYDLPEEKADALLARAKDDFAKLDAPAPAGFIAPAWLLGDAACSAVERAGFQYTTYLTAMRFFGTGQHKAGSEYLRSQSLVYSCRNLWRRTCSLLWNAALRLRVAGSSLLRISLHPPDYYHPAIWRQILRFAHKETARRETTTYGAFAGQHLPLIGSHEG